MSSGTIAQWWNRDREHREAEVEVLPELTIGDRLPQAAIGRRHQPDVHLNGGRAAQALEASGLDGAQDLRLQRHRQLTHFIQEQRAALGELEAARLALGGAGERAFLVAEQLGLEQRLRNRGAVDGDERRGHALAQGMKRAREQFLAGAAFALEQHGGVGAGGTLHRLQGVTDDRRLPDDLGHAAAFRGFFLEQVVLAQQPALRERALDHQQQVIGVNRLGQEVERPVLHRRDSILNGAVGGHDDDREIRIGVLGGAQHAESVAIRKPEIGEHDRRQGLAAARRVLRTRREPR